MKRNILRRVIFTIVGVASMSVACSDSGGVLGPLITITNIWRNEANADHTFFFNDNTNLTPRREGTFTGTETMPDGSDFPLTGSWSTNGRIQFTVQRATGNVTYTGTLTSNVNRMTVTSSAGSLTLIRL